MEDSNLSDQTGPLSDKMKSLPNGLKERLISSIVRDAVLEKAIEDALPKVDDCEREDWETSPGTEAGPVRESSKPATTTASPHRKRKGGGTAKKGKGKRLVEPEEEIEESVRTQNGPVSSSPEAAAAPQPLEKTVRPESPREPASPDRIVLEPPPAAETSPDTSEQKAAAVTGPAEAPALSNTDIVGAMDATDGAGGDSGGGGGDLVGRPRGQPTTADRPPAPVQHSVFKSFFSTDLSIDDIDRQIEAKRMELVC